MTILSFGKELKELRKRAGIPSKVLSERVGKAVTYVSQLEREIIKNPSYEPCLQILLELGLDAEKAEKMLAFYDIKSKEEKKANFITNLRFAEEDAKISSNYYEKKLEQVEKSKNLFLQLADERFSTLGQYDNTRASKVLDNLNSILSSEETSDFFFSIFENDFSKLNFKEFEVLLRTIDKEYKDMNTEKIISEVDEIE